MNTYQEQVAKGLELQKQARDARADVGAASNNADTARKIIADLQAQVKAGYGHWEVRDQLKAATDELNLWETKIAEFKKRQNDLNADASRISVAVGRAQNLQTQFGLNQDEFEQVFEVYFNGGTYEDAKRCAAKLAAKAAGTLAQSTEYAFAFNPPGSVRW